MQPNALYSHVGSKDELLDALLDDILTEVTSPAGDDWRASLTGLLDSTRRALVEHPRLIDAFLTRPTRGPNALRLGEECLELLAAAGIEGERAVRALRSLLIFTLGYAAYEAPRAADTDRRGRVATSVESFRTSGLARSSAVATELAQMPGDEDFHAALGWMIDGLLDEGSGPPASAARP